MSIASVLAVVYFAAALLIALVVHECTQAFTAVRMGDPTPKMSGRVTINPRPHLDPFGSLLLPGILLLPVLFGRLAFPLFAYGKPMPLNPWSLRKPDHQTTVIALAGPVANILVALGFGLVFRVAGGAGELGRFLGACLLANVSLGVLNLVPLPSLDGAKVVARFLPPRAREVYTNLDQYGALFILLVFFILPGPIFAFVRVVGNGICGLVGVDCAFP